MRRPVYDTIHLPVGYDHAAGHLRSSAAGWLPPPATPADDGYVVTMRAAGLLAGAGVDALVRVMPPTMDDALLVRPVVWRALNVERAFPRLAADLELHPVNETSSRLVLVGAYEPPVGVVGETADRVLGHHVADAVVRMFLEGVAGGLTAPELPPTLHV